MADSLTDEQLVEELQSYGESVSLPIKANKRPILIKKLNHLRYRNKPPVHKGKVKQPVQRRNLNLDAFSSDDSDNELRSTSTGVGTSEPSPGSASRSPTPSASSKITEVVTRSLRRRPGVGLQNATSTVHSRRSTDPGETSRNLRSHTQHAIFEADDLSPNGSSYRSRSLYPDLSTFSPGSSASGDLSLSDRSTIPFESSDSDIDGSSYEVVNKSVNTSFSLNRGAGSPSSNHVRPNRQSFETNHTYRKVGPISQGKQKRRFYPEHVSFGLVALVLAFFVIIFFGYMIVRKELFMGWFFSDSASQGNLMTNIKERLPYGRCIRWRCRKSFFKNPPKFRVRPPMWREMNLNSRSLHFSKSDKYNYLLCTGEKREGCYNEDEVQQATIVIKDLYTDLSTRKGRVQCGDAEEAEQRLLGTNLLKDLQQKKELTGSGKLEEAERLYNCSVDLIIANPSWNVRALTSNGYDAKKKSEVEYLESAVGSMGILCRLRRSISRVMWSLFILVAGVIILGTVLVLLWWRIQAKEMEEQKVFAMVEQIIDVLKEQHEFVQNEDTTEQSGMAVQHVRDQLLPPSRRKAMQKIWDKAVKFIEANESRVRLETQIIEGEEFAVWRWIQAVPNGGKVWQGQAFGEHNENNTSAAIYSPTPCLKIRNMFDKDVESEDHWEDSVKDALLEKSQDIKSLVHIFVDSNSKEGCVYVKCNSKEAAGRVRQALHGWWFDGRLVTVKHLKVEHYHNRWPEAKFAWRPLQPSTNQMRSLAQPYHRSSLEMT